MKTLVYAGGLGVLALFVLIACAQPDKKGFLKEATEAKSTIANESYVIGPEDVLYIHVWKEEGLTKTLPVRMDGNISLPLIREVKAAGFTPLQLEAVITEKLKEFYESPTVSVIVMEANSFNVYVSGEVGRPGVYRLRSETNILQIIPMAGGFTEWAKEKRKIFVVRKENGREKRFNIDFNKAMKGDDPSSNVILKAGDTIVVEASVWEKGSISPDISTAKSTRKR